MKVCVQAILPHVTRNSRPSFRKGNTQAQNCRPKSIKERYAKNTPDDQITGSALEMKQMCMLWTYTANLQATQRRTQVDSLLAQELGLWIWTTLE